MFAYKPALDAADSGFAVVTDRFICLLGAGTTAEAATDLYRALDANPVHIDDALDAILARHGLEQFAIAEVLDPARRSMNIAVRGTVSVNLDGSTTTRLTGPAGATWITGEASGVTALAFALDTGEADAASLPIRRGVVRAHEVLLDASLHTPGDTADAFVDDPYPRTVPIDVPRIRAATADAKVAASKKPDSVRTPAASTRVDISGMVDDAPSPLLMRLPDGNELDAATPVVFGRRPWPVESTAPPAVHVAVPSPLREVSGKHLEVGEAHGRLTATDLGSTNGTVVVSPDRAPRLLDGGRSTVLVAGDLLDLGEGFQIVIVGT